MVEPDRYGWQYTNPLYNVYIMKHIRNKVQHTPSYVVGYIAGILDVLLYGSLMWIGYTVFTYI